MHTDIAPWNMLEVNHQLSGLVDFDSARPGRAIEDVAYAAWHMIPLHDEGTAPPPLTDRPRRLRVFADTRNPHRQFENSSPSPSGSVCALTPGSLPSLRFTAVGSPLETHRFRVVSLSAARDPGRKLVGVDHPAALRQNTSGELAESNGSWSSSRLSPERAA